MSLSTSFTIFVALLLSNTATKLYGEDTAAYQSAWLNLLHYKRGGIAETYVSRIDDPKFFLAKDGKQNPGSEWRAFSKALLDPKRHIELMCLFPARYELFQQLNPSAALPDLTCRDLQQWLTRLNATHVSLIFASSYPNNPGSLFGHTFLKLSPASIGIDKDMLSYGASYAADVGDVNALTYIASGLTGGFMGSYSIAPYYLKLREYAHLENRDLFEYRLNLNEKEVRRLTLHLWEMLQHGGSDYYFLDENCSFAMLALLQAAKPDAHFLDGLPAIVSPMETLQKVYAHPNLVESIKFFPSDHHILAKALDHLNADQKTLLNRLINAEITPQEVNDAAILDTLILYEQFEKFKKFGHLQNVKNQIMEKALEKRASLKQPEISKKNDEMLPYAPHALHSPRVLSLAAERRDHTNAIRLGFRPGYHDLLDPAMSDRYLSVIALQSSLSANKKRILGWRTTILDLKSLEPLRMFDPKPSWRLNATCGANYDDDDAEHYCRAFIGGGLATQISKNFIVAGMPLLELGSLSTLDHRAYGGVGLSLLSYLALGDILSLSVDLKSLRIRSNSTIATSYEGATDLTVHTSSHSQVFLNYLRKRMAAAENIDHSEFTLGIGVFF